MKYVLILGIFLTSCAKRYDCECQTLDYSTGNVSVMDYPINAKKQDAEKKCNSGDEDSGSFYRDCHIR
jgi:hypothetical protein